jgi:hypothetical protein
VKSFVAVLILGSGCIAIAAEKPLAVVQAAFARGEDGPAEAGDEDFVPGETIHFSCRVEGFHKLDKPDDYGKQSVSLKFQIEVRDKAGALLKPIEDGKV